MPIFVQTTPKFLEHKREILRGIHILPKKKGNFYRQISSIQLTTTDWFGWFGPSCYSTGRFAILRCFIYLLYRGYMLFCISGDPIDGNFEHNIDLLDQLKDTNITLIQPVIQNKLMPPSGQFSRTIPQPRAPDRPLFPSGNCNGYELWNPSEMPLSKGRWKMLHRKRTRLRLCLLKRKISADEVSLTLFC